MFKKTFLLLAMALVFLPDVALAINGEILPEYNPLCWKEEACNEQRAAIRNINKDQLKKDYGDGWFKNEAPCVGGPAGKEWGKCLPVGVITTQVAFAGRTQFLHIGDFIHTIYKYAVAIAGIIAVFMLIIAGFQWVTSAGNSEAIGSAKKRIVGAVTGLLIAYLSFVILNSINPALTNLRLPQVWMLRPQAIVPQFCSTAAAVKASTVFGYSGKDATDQTSKLDLTKLAPNFDLTYNGKSDDPSLNKNYKGPETGQASFYCGNRFFIKDGGASACFGDVCKAGEVCVDTFYTGKPAAQKYYCTPGMLAGSIMGNAGGLSNQVVNSNVGQDPIHLLALCKAEGKIELVDNIDTLDEKKPHNYKFAAQANLEKYCGGEKNIAGFYLGIETNDKTSGLSGGVMEGLPGSTAVADWFAIGQESPGSRMCDVNLAKLARNFYSQYVNPNTCDVGNLGCTCGFLSQPWVAWSAASQPDFVKHLISLEELKKGYQCNVTIDRTNFPAADNGAKWPGWKVVASQATTGAVAGAGGCMILGVLTAGTAPAACALAAGIIYPAVNMWQDSIYGMFDDPTSCRDKQ